MTHKALATAAEADALLEIGTSLLTSLTKCRIHFLIIRMLPAKIQTIYGTKPKRKIVLASFAEVHSGVGAVMVAASLCVSTAHYLRPLSLSLYTGLNKISAAGVR